MDKRNLYINHYWSKLVFFITFLIFINVHAYDQSYFEGKPYIDDANGKVYIFGSPDESVEKIKPSLFELIKRYPGKNWRIILQRNYNYIESIDIHPLNIKEQEAKNFSMEFIQAFSHLFGINPTEISYSTKISGKRFSTRFFQNINNIPIVHSFLGFHFEDDGLVSISSRLYPNAKRFITDTIPKITEEQACEIACKDAYKMEKGRLPPYLECSKCELAIVPKKYATFVSDEKQKDFYLVWQIDVGLDPQKYGLFSYEYYIDAMTGELINKWSNILY